jgi:cytochrome c-type biogenesis protein
MILFDFDGTHVTLLIAYFSGVGGFFASCFFPLLPIYFAYLTGEAAPTDTNKDDNRLIRLTLLFSLGFFLAFSSLGLMLARFAVWLAAYKMWLNLGGALVTILLGLIFVGAVSLPIFTRERHWLAPQWTKRWPWLSAFLLGMGMAWGWSPCIGPVLAVVLFWAADQSTFWQAFALLLAFSAGMTTPFVAFGVTAHRLTMVFRDRIGRIGHWLRIIGGITMVFMGTRLLLEVLL